MKILLLTLCLFSFNAHTKSTLVDNFINFQNSLHDFNNSQEGGKNCVGLSDSDILLASYSNPNYEQCSLKDIPSYFRGGTSSPLACIIGVNEGTRTTSCKTTIHYISHIELSNGKLNTGSFSSNGRGLAPEKADIHWLNKMKGDYPRYVKGVRAAGFDPDNAMIFLTFMDLYTQSPEGALGWNDKKSTGKGFLGHLKDLKGQKIDMDKLNQIRFKSFYNTRGGWEGALSKEKTKDMFLYRMVNLGDAIHYKWAGIRCK